MIKAAVFDLDHTLYDRYKTLEIISKNIRLVFDINPKLTDKEIAELMILADKTQVHKGWDRLQEYLINETMLFNTKPEYDEYRKFVMGNFMHTAIPFDFTIPVLTQLRNEGYLLGLITNGSYELQSKKLELLNLTDKFDCLFLCGKEGFSKPDTAPFIITAKRLKVSPNECVYIGDNPLNDVEASRKAGYTPIFVNTTGTWVLPEIKKPKYSVETIKEIPNLLKEINLEG